MGLAWGRHSRIHDRNCACKKRSVNHSAPHGAGNRKGSQRGVRGDLPDTDIAIRDSIAMFGV